MTCEVRDRRVRELFILRNRHGKRFVVVLRSPRTLGGDIHSACVRDSFVRFLGKPVAWHCNMSSFRDKCQCQLGWPRRVAGWLGWQAVCAHTPGQTACLPKHEESRHVELLIVRRWLSWFPAPVRQKKCGTIPPEKASVRAYDCSIVQDSYRPTATSTCFVSWEPS